MPRSREIPLALRDQAVGLARAGKTYGEIATILNIHYLQYIMLLENTNIHDQPSIIQGQDGLSPFLSELLVK